MENMKFCCFNEGKHKLHAVADLYRELFNGVEPKTGLPHKGPILYRWWFGEKSKVMKTITDFAKKDQELADFLRSVERYKENNTTYYALYFGKGVNGRRRLKNHLSPHKRSSTLRRTIGALLNTENENDITKELQLCFYDWCEMLCKEELSDREEQAIKDGYYPLNLSENNKNSKEWKTHLQQLRNSK